MKLTKELIKDFESDQKAYGTRTAIFNLLWLQATEQLSNLGCTRTRTTNPHGTRPS